VARLVHPSLQLHPRRGDDARHDELHSVGRGVGGLAAQRHGQAPHVHVGRQLVHRRQHPHAGADLGGERLADEAPREPHHRRRFDHGNPSESQRQHRREGCQPLEAVSRAEGAEDAPPEARQVLHLHHPHDGHGRGAQQRGVRPKRDAVDGRQADAGDEGLEPPAGERRDRPPVSVCARRKGQDADAEDRRHLGRRRASRPRGVRGNKRGEAVEASDRGGDAKAGPPEEGEEERHVSRQGGEKAAVTGRGRLGGGRRGQMGP